MGQDREVRQGRGRVSGGAPAHTDGGGPHGSRRGGVLALLAAIGAVAFVLAARAMRARDARMVAAGHTGRTIAAPPEPAALAARETPTVIAAANTDWDFDAELRKDRRFERSLLYRELAVVAIIVALVVLRIAFVR